MSYLLRTIAMAVPTFMSLSVNSSWNQGTSTDPLDCKVPACHDKISIFKKAMQNQNASSTKSNASANDSINQSKSKQKAPKLPSKYIGCPLDRSELGRSSWNLLHTMAANYPNSPTEEEQLRMKEFIVALSLFYPCVHCAADFQRSIKQSPPR